MRQILTSFHFTRVVTVVKVMQVDMPHAFNHYQTCACLNEWHVNNNDDVRSPVCCC